MRAQWHPHKTTPKSSHRQAQSCSPAAAACRRARHPTPTARKVSASYLEFRGSSDTVHCLSCACAVCSFLRLASCRLLNLAIRSRLLLYQIGIPSSLACGYMYTKRRVVVTVRMSCLGQNITTLIESIIARLSDSTKNTDAPRLPWFSKQKWLTLCSSRLHCRP